MTWAEELAFPAPPPYHRLGLRSCPEERWLLGGDDLAGQLEVKAKLLAERHGDIVQAEPGSELAAAELAETVDAWLDRLRPGAQVPTEPGLHPIDAAARPIAEDLCLLERHDDKWILTAASLAFPSRWRLADKLGRSVTALHGPVPHYDNDVAEGVVRFFDRLRPGRIAWRRNHSLHATDELHEPVATPPAGPCPPEDLWLRSERQTLRRLPRTGAIVFTIRTQQMPLADTPTPVRHGLAGWLATLDPPLADYKTGDFDAKQTIAWLSR